MKGPEQILLGPGCTCILITAHLLGEGGGDCWAPDPPPPPQPVKQALAIEGMGGTGLKEKRARLRHPLIVGVNAVLTEGKVGCCWGTSSSGGKTHRGMGCMGREGKGGREGQPARGV